MTTLRRRSPVLLLLWLVLAVACSDVFAAQRRTTARRPAATASSTAEPGAAKKDWTFMVFMAADNNLEAGGEFDMNEMETIGSTDRVNIVVQLDRSGRYSQDSDMKWSGCRRYLIKKDSQPKKVTSPMIQDLGQIDMAAPATLLNFVDWASRTYPARRYALILWNHGTGWKEIQPDVAPSIMTTEPGTEAAPFGDISYNISYDDTAGSSMDIPTLGKTLAQVKEILGQPVDLLGFDACLMQMLEVAHEASSYARFQVGSADLEPERGWPYDAFLAKLAANPSMDGRQLGSAIVDTYKASYQMGSQGNTAVTLSLLDLSKVASIAQGMNSLVTAMKTGIREIDRIEHAREATLKYVYKDYVDLGHFLEILGKTVEAAPIRTAATKLLAALQGENGLIVKHASAGDKYKDATGLCIFLPDRAGFRTYKNRYKLLSMSKNTGWYKLLDELESPSLPYVKLVEVVLEDENRDGRFAAGEKVRSHLTMQNFGKESVGQLTVTAETASGGLDKKEQSMEITGIPGPGKKQTADGPSFQILPDAKIDSEVTLTFTIRGEKSPASTFRTTFYVKAPFQTSGHVLLAFTDAFSPAPPVLQTMFRDSNITFDPWDRMLDGELKPDVLKRYTDGWVFVSAQDSSDQQQLSAAELEALTGYLKSGGRLVLSGQDLAFSLRDSAFLKTMCKAGFVQDDTNVHVVSGLTGGYKGQTYQIFGGDGANNQKWPDEIDPLTGAKAIMKFDSAARDLANDHDMNGPDLKPSSPTRGIKSSGAAAIEVIDGYRLLFFAFGIEAINDAGQRNAVLKNIAAFMTPTLDSQVRDLAGAASRRPARRSTSNTRQYLDDVDFLTEVRQNITRRVKREMERKPETAAALLETIERLPAEQREGVSELEKQLHDLLEFQRQHGTFLNR
ncbi:MAG TPA: clostripain-related cysteine peptidase [Candidatus Ozemobacteraceae bacterium]